MCVECYSEESRITPLLHGEDCLTNHLQYVCGTCGRCICYQADPKRHLMRWQFPFSTLEKAILYLRTADYFHKKACGIYQLTADNGRNSYKIFSAPKDFDVYLQKNPKKSGTSEPVFQMPAYIEYPDTRIARLTADEIAQYLAEQS